MPMVVIGVSKWNNFKLKIEKDIGKKYSTAKLGDFRDLETDGNRLHFRLVYAILATGQLK